ncbi:hypothetical protein MRB53_006061 [Persea americana]|uniref:Uncharacterized protein n=1 Tax=Persea americana TaxID=3435 RepID=A0ACC2MFL2_PERAE|nr:hypothetical protein MRB53_006061 [Persea americana]
MAVPHPPSLPPPEWIEGKLSIKIPQHMVFTGKESFSFSAIGRFVRRRPSLERLKRWVHASWSLSRPCLSSLTEKGNFLFRFNSPEDLSSMNEDSWPTVSSVWIRLRGILYDYWSSNILLSIASYIGNPFCLDETTATQRILSYDRVLANLDVSNLLPYSISVDLEADAKVEVELQYENIPCSKCLSAGHLTAKCPFASKRGTLRKPGDPRGVKATLPDSLATARGSPSSAPEANGKSVLHNENVLTVDTETGQLSALFSEGEANLGNSREHNATLPGPLATASGSEVMPVMNGNSGPSSAPTAVVLNPKVFAFDPLCGVELWLIVFWDCRVVRLRA